MLAGFPQHVMCCEVHALPHRWCGRRILPCSTVDSFLTAFAAGAVKKNARFSLSPKKNAIRALYLGRGLAKLEVFRVAHAGDQLLRLFAERIEFLSLVHILL